MAKRRHDATTLLAQSPAVTTAQLHSEPMPPQRTTFAALKHREFRRFYFGSIASQLGFWFSHISFQDLMSDLTDDEFWVALIFVATFAPVLVLGPFGGLLADRLDRKKLLLGTYVALISTALFQVVFGGDRHGHADSAPDDVGASRADHGRTWPNGPGNHGQHRAA